MIAGKCRACNGPLKGRHSVDASAQAFEVQIIVRAPGKRRDGYFSLCSRCVCHAVLSQCESDVSLALLAEFKVLSH